VPCKGCSAELEASVSSTASRYGIAVLCVVLLPACYLTAFVGEILRRCCPTLLLSEDTPSMDMVAPNTAPLPGASGRGVNAGKQKKGAER